MIPATEKPVFVPKYKPEHGGTDFLGLRIVNVMLMDNCFPGINNVSYHIRPFSLLSWIHWKFYELAAVARIARPTSNELKTWQEKIEVLFTWSHVLKGVRGIPGVDALRPKGQAAPLDFESWGRNPTSTSLMAAIQYGPPAKSPNGLGFLEATESRLHRTVGPGIDLAMALDASMGIAGPRRLTADLKAAKATDAEAAALFEHWTIRTPSRAERTIFRSVLYSSDSVSASDNLGRRSATIELVLSVIDAAGTPLAVGEIRKAMFYGLIHKPLRPAIPDRLTAAWCKWVCLCVRQAQRLAMECLLAWVERRLGTQGDRITDTMVAIVEDAWSERQKLLPKQQTLRSIRAQLRSPRHSLQDLLESSHSDSAFSLFDQMDELQGNAADVSGTQVLRALRVLFLCAEWVAGLRALHHVDVELTWGGPERVSLSYLHDHLERCGDMSVGDFVRLFLEQQIISQHLSVAANRYDGGSQRLRITIEEEGLTLLAPDELPLTVTPDRLYTALSLMSECQLVKFDDKEEAYSPGRSAFSRSPDSAGAAG